MVALALIGSLAAAPGYAAEPPVFDTALTDARIAPGSSGKVTFLLGIPDDYHVFRDMLEVRVVSAGVLRAGTPVYPPGEGVPDPVDPTRTREQWTGSVAVDLPFTAPASAEGPQTVVVSARFQGCKDTLCTMPITRELRSVVTVAVPPSPSEGVGASPPPLAPAAPPPTESNRPPGWAGLALVTGLGAVAAVPLRRALRRAIR